MSKTLIRAKKWMVFTKVKLRSQTQCNSIVCSCYIKYNRQNKSILQEVRKKKSEDEEETMRVYKEGFWNVGNIL